MAPVYHARFIFSLVISYSAIISVFVFLFSLAFVSIVTTMKAMRFRINASHIARYIIDSIELKFSKLFIDNSLVSRSRCILQ